MDSIPTRLRALRESKGITLRQLAERLGVGHSAIAKWETGVNDVGINLIFLGFDQPDHLGLRHES